jgi:hypothetical protein
MKEQALKMAQKYKMRADFVKLNFERSGRKRMATTEISKIKLYSKTDEMIRKLVAHIEELENPIMQAIAQAFDEQKKLNDEEILKKEKKK